MNATRLSSDIAVLAAAAALGACGGSAADSETADDDGKRAVVARQTPTRVTVTQPAASRSAPRALGSGLPLLHGAAAARRECNAVVPYMVAMTYGGASNDMEAISFQFARHRAAPEAREAVRRGCRAGLRD